MTPDLSIQDSDKPDRHQLFYTYNCFIAIALFIQALLIYLPRHLWYEHEEEIARKLHVAELEGDRIVQIDQAQMDGFARDVVKFLLTKPKVSKYSLHVSFEIGNLLIALGQIVLMNRYLNGHFYSYGLNFLSHLCNKSHPNPMDLAFPLLTRCAVTRHLFALNNASTYVERVEDEEYSCALIHNRHNRIYFLLLWFWFSLLILLGLLNLAYRLACISRRLRSKLLRNLSQLTSLLPLLDHLSLGQLYILRVLEDNLPEDFVKQVVEELNGQLKEQQGINLVQLGENFDKPVSNG